MFVLSYAIHSDIALRGAGFDYHSIMYLDFFKLQQLPFRLTADPRFHYENMDRAEAKRDLLAALGAGTSADGSGCILVSGDAGVGKTILVHDVLGLLQDRCAVIRISQPEISVAEFYAAITAELENDAPASSAAAANLETCLANQAALGRLVVLALDNGEALGEELLEELLRLPGRSGIARRSLRVILAARTTLEGTLRKFRLGDQQTQLGLRIKLAPLAADETRSYVEHRLRIAGWLGGAIFGDDALVEVQRFTGGVPRLINTLADAALMAAFNRSHSVVTASDIRGAAKQLQWVEFNAHAQSNVAPAPIAAESLIGHVRIEHKKNVVAEFDLPIGKIALGRSSSNDVRIDSRYISRNHCQLVTTAQYSVIEDLQSQNGLTVAARRVSVHRLHHGDRVQMGEHVLTYTQSPQVGPPRANSFPLSVGSESGAAVALDSSASDTGQTGLIVSVPAAANGADPKGD